MALQNLLGGLMLAAVRKDSDGALVADGSETRLLVNEDGRLKVASKPGSMPLCAGTLTTTAAAATAVSGAGAVAGNGFVAVDVSNSSNVVFHVNNTGTAAMAAGQFAFEASLDSTTGTDGTWFAIQAVASNANTIVTNTGTLSIAIGAGHTVAWECSVNGNMWVRIRCTTSATTNAAARWSILRGVYATEPIPAAQVSATQPVSGSVTSTPATPTAYTLSGAATTNAAVVKATAGTLYSILVSNTAASTVFLKLYNKATAPTVGTDVPVAVVPVPASGLQQLSLGALGHRFGAGIGIAITAGAADTDTAAITASTAKVFLSYV